MAQAVIKQEPGGKVEVYRNIKTAAEANGLVYGKLYRALKGPKQEYIDYPVRYQKIKIL